MREIIPIPDLDAEVEVPGSKSMTNRGLAIGALADGETVLGGALRCEDTERMAAALRQLGFDVEEGADGATFRIRGGAGRIPRRRADLDVGSSGTALRVLTALCSLGDGEYRVDGEPGLRRRPVEPLCSALRRLGGRVECARSGGAPVRVSAGPVAGDEVRVDGGLSSQFASALLLIGPCLRGGLTVEVTGTLVSAPYLDVTTEVMARFGARVRRESPRRFFVEGGGYRATRLEIEGDASAASYFLAAAALTGGRVRVTNLRRDSRQGDVRILSVLEAMGCEVLEIGDGAEVRGRPLRAVEVDLRDAPDLVPTVAAAAMVADGRTTIRGVPHLRVKESDRIDAVLCAVRALGGRGAGLEDGLWIEGGPVAAGVVDPMRDHRIAMAFALLGLKRPGIRIADAGCVAKSFPDFFRRLADLGS